MNCLLTTIETMILLFAPSIFDVELATVGYQLICEFLGLLGLHGPLWSFRFLEFLRFLEVYYLITLSPQFICVSILLLARCALFLLCSTRQILAWPLSPMIHLSLLLRAVLRSILCAVSLSLVTYPLTLICVWGSHFMCLATVSLSL